MIATQRLVPGHALGEQRSFDAIYVLDPLGDRHLALAAEMARSAASRGRGSARLYANSVRSSVSPSILSVFARQRRRDVALKARSTTWLSIPPFCRTRSGIRPPGESRFFHRGCGYGLILNCSSEFESSAGSHAVRSPGCYFPVGENRRHSRGLGWGEPVSGRQLPVFRSVRGGFWAPVSDRHFSISISAGRRPVRLLTETGSQSALRVMGFGNGRLHGLRSPSPTRGLCAAPAGSDLGARTRHRLFFGAGDTFGRFRRSPWLRAAS
jgi:hypothetical protein